MWTHKSGARKGNQMKVDRPVEEGSMVDCIGNDWRTLLSGMTLHDFAVRLPLKQLVNSTLP